MGNVNSLLNACCANRRPRPGEHDFRQALVRSPGDDNSGMRQKNIPALQPEELGAMPGSGGLARRNRTATSDGELKFLAACRRGEVRIATILHQHGIPLDVEDKDGAQAMHWACYSGHLGTVQWLHNSGIALDVQTEFGSQPLHWACYGGHIHVVQWLHQQGVALDVDDSLGQQPVHWATRNGQLLVAKWLHSQTLRAGPGDDEHATGVAAKPPFSLLWRATADPSVLGLQWQRFSTYRPQRGREVVCPELSRALVRRTRFTRAELSDFRLSAELQPDSFIRAGDQYFRPVTGDTV
mmetsp:Transcript_18885/g.48272  ORF Transcript_18885/g.48272 Transcript_18885/m.48272 type:complete len:296 (+) Transcript_18885:81-968(+)